MANTYGYCRISTARQSIERQERNIKDAYPAAVIVKETYTGTSMNRDKWEKLAAAVREGDTIVFDSVSRMSRNAAEGFAAYEELFNRGINLVFIKEPHINTDTYKKAVASGVAMTGGAVDFILEGINRYLLELAKEQIRLAFEQAEKEVADLRQRTKEGILTKRLEGKAIGGEVNKGRQLTVKKADPAKAKIQKYSVDFGGSLNDTETMKICGISRNTLKKYKAELKAAAV